MMGSQLHLGTQVRICSIIDQDRFQSRKSLVLVIAFLQIKFAQVTQYHLQKQFLKIVCTQLGLKLSGSRHIFVNRGNRRALTVEVRRRFLWRCRSRVVAGLPEYLSDNLRIQDSRRRRQLLWYLRVLIVVPSFVYPFPSFCSRDCKSSAGLARPIGVKISGYMTATLVP